MKNNVSRKKNQRKDKAVSEVIGTILLVGIGVSLFALLAIATFTMPSLFFSDPAPSVNILARIEGNTVVFEHHGGQSVSLDSEIVIWFAETRFVSTVGDVLGPEFKADGLWNIGEKIRITNNDPNLHIMHISASITDKNSGSFIMRGVIQPGSQAVNPIAVTLHADAVTTNTARIHMHYDYRFYIGTKEVCFTYIKASEYIANNSAVWNSTGWVQVFNQNGSYNFNLINLNENTEYFYQAWVRFNSSSNASQKLTSSGTINMFRTDSYASGLWHFDESSGLIAIDSTNNKNNGTLFPANVKQAAQRLNQSEDVVSNRSLRFDGYNDYVIVNHASSISPTSQIAIEAWVKPEFKTEFKGTSLQRLNSTMFGTQTYGCLEPDIISITTNRFAIVSRNSALGGFVVTTEISDNGTIKQNATTSLIDIFQFETVRCETPKIIKVVGSTDIYAIVYRGPSGNLYMTTIQITADGTINKVIKERRVIDAVDCYHPDIIYTDNDYYAIVYPVREFYLAANRFVGRLQIAQITSTGAITPQKSYHNFGSASTAAGIMQYPNIINVNNDFYSIVYRDSDTDGSLRAVELKNGFVVFVDSVVYKFDNDNTSDLPFRIIHVSGNVYAVFYGDREGALIRGGAVVTMRLSNDGKMEDTLDYALLLPPADWSQFTNPEIIRIAGDIFAITYRVSTRAEIKTFEISSLGIITTHMSDSAWTYAFQPASSYTINTPKIIKVNPSIDTPIDTYAVVYPKTIGSDTNNGVLLTIKIADNGTILKNIYDSVLLGPVNFYAPDIVHVSNDIYAIAGRKVLRGDMFVRTITISPTGKIENSFIDFLDIPMPELTPGYTIKITHVTDKIYLIAFDNYANPAVTLKTIEIGNDGTIGDVILCSYNITKTGYSGFCSPDVIRIKDDIFAVSYHITNYASKSDFISTIKISSAGNISLIDTFSTNSYFSSVFGYDEYTALIPINGSTNLYGLLYAYDYFIPGQHRGLGLVMTLEINDMGIITQTPFATYVFDSYGCSRPDIIHVKNFTYAIAYSKSVLSGNYRISGHIQTMHLSPNGTKIHNIDTTPFMTVNTNSDLPHSQFIYPVYRDVYALIYTIPSGSSYKGYIGTFCIASDGSIYRNVDNVIFNAQLALLASVNILPSYVPLTSNVLAVCYQGNFDDGYIETIRITVTDTSNTLKNIISKAGSYEIKGNKTTFVAILRTTSGFKTLSLPVNQGWNYLVLSYDRTNIKFFNNLTNVSLPCVNENIVTTTNRLIFGGFSGIYDEFALYQMHLRDDEIYDRYMLFHP